MKIFFDTEFAGFAKDGPLPYLISIGCIAENGQEFYAELNDTWDDHLCSLFVIDTVLPLLQGGEHSMSISVMAPHLKAWIESFEEEVTFHSDAPTYDWPFIEEIFTFHGWPSNLRKKCSGVYFNHDRQIHRYQAATVSYWHDHGAKQHHALWDARCLHFAWKYAVKKGLRC